MTDRYIITTRTGERAVRTNSDDEAQRYHAILGGQIVDRQKENA